MTLTTRAIMRALSAAIMAGLAVSIWTSLGHAQAPQTYKFGLAMPLSGSQALYGSDQVKAAVEKAAGDDQRSTASLVEKIVVEWLRKKGYLKQ